MTTTIDLHHHIIPDFYDAGRRAVIDRSSARLIPRLARAESTL